MKSEAKPQSPSMVTARSTRLPHSKGRAKKGTLAHFALTGCKDGWNAAALPPPPSLLGTAAPDWLGSGGLAGASGYFWRRGLSDSLDFEQYR